MWHYHVTLCTCCHVTNYGRKYMRPWQTLTCRSTHSVMVPALLCVPSMFQMVFGVWSRSLPIFILFRIFSLMKLSVAPESTRTSRSAFARAVCKRVGIFKDLYLHANTLLSHKVRAQAAGFAPFKNPIRIIHHPRHSTFRGQVPSFLLRSWSS